MSSDTFGYAPEFNAEESAENPDSGETFEETFDHEQDAPETDESDNEQEENTGEQTGSSSKGKKASKPAASPARPSKSGGQFGWSDVESIMKFVSQFNDGSEKEQAALKSVFGVPAKSDALATAQALYSGSSMSVYKEAAGFIDTVIQGKFDIMATFSLISDLSKQEEKNPEYVRDFFKVVNAFLPEEVRYRKNAPLPNLLEPLVTNSQKSLSEDDRKIIKWIDDLLAVWPK